MSDSYKAKFRLESGQNLEIALSEDAYEKLATVCKSKFPQKKWQCSHSE